MVLKMGMRTSSPPSFRQVPANFPIRRHGLPDGFGGPAKLQRGRCEGQVQGIWRLFRLQIQVATTASAISNGHPHRIVREIKRFITCINIILYIINIIYIERERKRDVDIMI
jgi:hypothetical protein